MWLHFIERDGDSIAREWGFETEWGDPISNIPAVGDFVWLSVGLPDQEPSDTVKARVISREWCFECEADIEVVLHVEFAKKIDSELKPDSQLWPLQEYTKLMKQIEFLK